MSLLTSSLLSPSDIQRCVEILWFAIMVFLFRNLPRAFALPVALTLTLFHDVDVRTILYYSDAILSFLFWNAKIGVIIYCASHIAASRISQFFLRLIGADANGDGTVNFSDLIHAIRNRWNNW